MEMKPGGILKILQSNLKDRYKDDFCIIQELIQNADDAKAENVFFCAFPSLSSLHPLGNGHGLLILNDGELTQSNLDAINSIAESDKDKDSGKIGKFGLGMKSVFHVCEGFFMFGKGYQGCSLPFFCTPWAKSKYHHDWVEKWETNKEEINSQLETGILPDIVRKWSRWFCVCLPFRDRGVDGEILPIIKQYPSREDLLKFVGSEYATRAARLLPMLKHVKNLYFSCERDVTHWSVGDKSLRITGERDGSFCGGVFQENKTPAYVFLGNEEKGKNPRFAEFQEDTYWPERFTEGEHGYENVKDKTNSHAAVCILKEPSAKPAVAVALCVFLPLSEPQDKDKEDEYSHEITDKTNKNSFLVYIHGNFFVDAGRQRIQVGDYASDVGNRKPRDEQELCIQWNQLLLKDAALPLLIPVLERCAESWLEPEIDALMEALVEIEWIKRYRKEICAKDFFIKELTPEGFRWRKIQSADAVYKFSIPDGEFAKALAEVLKASSIHLADKQKGNLYEESSLTAEGNDKRFAEAVFSVSMEIPVADVLNEGTKNFWLSFFGKIGMSEGNALCFWKRILSQYPMSNYSDFLKKYSDVMRKCRTCFTVIDNAILHSKKEVSIWQEILSVLEETIVLPKSDELPEGEGSFNKEIPFAVAQEILAKLQKLHLSENKGLKFLEQLVLACMRACDDIEQLDECIKKYSYWNIGGKAFSYNEFLRRAGENKLYIRTSEEQNEGIFLGAVEWSLQCIPDDINKALRLNLQCPSELLFIAILQQRPNLKSVQGRANLLKFLLGQIDIKSRIESKEYRKACRYLIHGNPDLFDRDDSFLTPLEGKFADFSSKIVETLAEKRFCIKYTIPAEILRVLNPEQRNSLGFPLPEPAQLVLELAKNAKDISFEGFPEDSWKKLVGMAALDAPGVRDALTHIPLFPTTRGTLVALKDDSCFLETKDAPVPELFRDEVNILKDDDDSLETKRMRQLARTWDIHVCLRYCHAKTESSVDALSLAPIFVNILRKADKLSQNEKDYIATIQWVQLKDESKIAPKEIIALENIYYRIPGLIYLPDVSDPECQEILKHSGVLPDERTALSLIFDFLACDLQKFAIGELSSFNNKEKALSTQKILAILKNSDTMPVRDILNELDKARIDFEEYLFKIRKPLPNERLINEINDLNRRIKISKDEKEKKDIWDFLCDYLDSASGRESFKKDILPKIEFFNANGDLKKPSEICALAHNISKCYRLNDTYRYASLFQKQLVTKEGEETLHTPATASIIDFFKDWDPSFDERIGGFIICCSDQNNDKSFVKRRYGFEHRSIEETRNSLAPNFNAMMRNQIVKVYISSDEKIPICAIDGKTTINVPRERLKNVEDLFMENIGNPCGRSRNNMWASSAGDKYTLDLWLRSVSKEEMEEDITPRELDSLLRNTLEKIVKKCYSINLDKFDVFWDSLANGGQLQLKQTQAVILEHAFGFLPTFGCYDSKLKQILSEWDDVVRAEAQADENEGAPQNEGYYNEKKRLKKELKEHIQTNFDFQKQILHAMREKINSLNYSPISILFELFQNADDASEELCSLYVEQCGPAYVNRFSVDFDGTNLVIVHWGRQINQIKVAACSISSHDGYGHDLEKMLMLAHSTKDQQGQNVTGKFGLGFKTVYFVTDEPIVLSGRLRFKVIGGFFPEALSAEKDDELEQLRAKYEKVSPNFQPTIFILKVDEEYEKVVSEGIRSFEDNAELLTLFSKRIKSIDICESSGKRCNAKPNIRVENTEIPLKICGSNQEYALIDLWLDGTKSAQILLGHHDGHLVPLPEEIPTYWVTAPTKVRLDLGFALNANLDLNTGRSGLNTESDNNKKTIVEIANQLYRFLREQHSHLSTISFDAYKYYHELWSILTNYKNVKKWDAPELSNDIYLMRQIIWGGRDGILGGYKKFVLEYPIVPSGLPGNLKALCTIKDLEYAISQELAASPLLSLADSKRIKQGHVIAAELFKGVATVFFPGIGRNLPEYTYTLLLEDLKETYPCLSPDWCSSAEGKALNDGLLDELIMREGVREVLEKFMFLSKSGKKCWAKELLDAQNESEKLQAAFAPDDAILSDKYDDTGRELFKKCRGGKKLSHKQLGEFALAVISFEGQKAVFAYILGNPGSSFCEFLRENRAGTWLEALRNCRAFLQLSKRDCAGIGYALDDESCFDNSIVVNNEPQAREEPQELNYDKIYEWWICNEEIETRKYNQFLYDDSNKCDLTFNLDNSPMRSEWMELLVLGAAHTLGLKECQHKGFISMLKMRGFWNIYCNPTIQLQEWFETLDQFLDEEEINEEYAYWMRLFLRIYQFSKHLKDYIDIFSGVQFIEKIERPRDIFSIKANSKLSGSGITAPGLQEALGESGQCFVLREMIRRHAIENPETIQKIRRFCFVPHPSIMKEGNSESIYEKVRHELPDDRVTFCLAFDIAIVAYCKRGGGDYVC